MSDFRRSVVVVLVAGAVAVAGIAAGYSASSGSTAPVQPSGATTVDGPLNAPGGPFLTDSYGRVVILHGVNAVYKRAPYELYVDPGKPWNFTSADAARMAKLGFNVVRLGIIWQGIEPGTLGPNSPQVCSPGQPGDPHQFNPSIAAAYLARVAQTVNLLGKYGIYTLLDMHEDVYSSEFGGEGAPAWAVCTGTEPIRILPGRWSNTYNDPGLIAAVHNFWLNDVVGDLQGEYIRSWKTAATYFAGNPWVVGFDPINEPFTKTLQPGSTQVAARLECFYTGTSHPGLSIIDGSVLSCPPDDPPAGLIDTLRHAAPDKLVFFEPDIYSNQGHPNDIGPMNYRNLVFNFHDYCGLRSGVTGNPTDLNACAAQELRTMQHRSDDRPDIATAKQPEGPAWFMSEFGATTSEPLMDLLTRNADELQLGWTYWQWKYYDDPTGSSAEALVQSNGALSPTAAALDRAYPQAVAGTPVSYSFDPSTREFHLLYVPKSDDGAPTV
ncbi:MAG TPA: cellulase family glycosylhydrolase, partial [Acidimicrobiales bacterium]|nr:cellulase family glycosylhydrolase [Acidimicrobiales bacterium]